MHDNTSIIIYDALVHATTFDGNDEASSSKKPNQIKRFPNDNVRSCFRTGKVISIKHGFKMVRIVIRIWMFGPVFSVQCSMFNRNGSIVTFVYVILENWSPLWFTVHCSHVHNKNRRHRNVRIISQNYSHQHLRWSTTINNTSNNIQYKVVWSW